MSHFLKTFTILLFVALGLRPALVEACSVRGIGVLPTNFEMVQLADAIVIARVDQVLPRKDDDDDGTVFKTLEVLKGSPPEFFSTYLAHDPGIAPSDPDNIASAHPQAYWGGCVRYDVSEDYLYVIFLEQVEATSEYRVFKYPFARNVEEVTGDDAIWVEVIKFYLNVQEGRTPMEQIAFLEKRLKALNEQEPTPRTLALANDISNHLSIVSVFKPAEYLLDAYFDPETDPEIKEPIIFMLTTDGHPEAADFFEELIDGPDRDKYLGLAIKFYASNGNLQRAAQLFRDNVYKIYQSRTPQGIGAIGSSLWPLFEESTKSQDGLTANDVLQFFWFLREEGFAPEGGYFYDNLKKHRPDNYYDAPRLTIVLANGLDEDVVDWALSELPSENDLPIRALLHALGGFRSQHDIIMDKLVKQFCDSEESRTVIFDEIAYVSSFRIDELLYGIATYDNLSREDGRQFMNTLKKRAKFALDQSLLYGPDRDIDGKESVALLYEFSQKRRVNVPAYIDAYKINCE